MSVDGSGGWSGESLGVWVWGMGSDEAVMRQWAVMRHLAVDNDEALGSHEALGSGQWNTDEALDSA